jgi:hypothetical protein
MSYNLVRVINNASFDNVSNPYDDVLKVKDIETKEYLSINDELEKIQHIRSDATTTIVDSTLDMKNYNIINCPSFQTTQRDLSCKIWAELTTFSPILYIQNGRMGQYDDYYAFLNGIGGARDWTSAADLIHQSWMSSQLQRLKPLSLNNNIIGIRHDIIPSNRYVNYHIRCGLKTVFKNMNNQGDFDIYVWIDARITCSDETTHQDKICLLPVTLKRNSTNDDFILKYNRKINYKKHLNYSYPSPIKRIEFTIKYRLQEQNLYTNIDAYMVGDDESNNYMYVDQQDIEDDSLSATDPGLGGAVLGDDVVL